MRMNNPSTREKYEMMGMLVTLGATYNQELNKALEKHDRENAMKFIELSDCIDKLLEDIKERF